LVLALVVGCFSGCNSAANSADDSMASTLEAGKKAQGVTSNEVKPKDSPNLKAPPATTSDTKDTAGATTAGAATAGK